MELVPDWLSPEFLSQCLKNEDDLRDIVITKFETSRAVAPGEYYSSCPTRVKVDYQNSKDDHQVHSLYLILKSELQGGAVKDIVDSFGCSESVFYKSFMPEARLLANVPFVPKSYFSPIFATIVLEDLKQQGFKMADKSQGLDFDHCRLYVTAVAALHAVSYEVLKEHPEFIESIGKEKLFSHGLQVTYGLQKMLRNGMRCLFEYIEAVDKFKKYSNIIKDSSGSLYDTVAEVVKPREEDFNTMIHGDSWTNNMLFRYGNNGSVEEIKLLDFQLVRYASPLVDIVYFIWTSANDDVRTNKLDELYKIYTDELNKSLSKINSTTNLSYENVKRKVKELSPLALCMAVVIPIFTSKDSVSDIEPIFMKGNEEKTYEIYKTFYSHGSFYTNRLPKLVKQLENTGVFDYLQEIAQ
ncbi:uncharacterized protein LOC124370012 isoform X2 [Homalodisca vitripennis]|nr:uncharacterized protein LOC124370012 isoform X2 [Homalodisca vitripennis]